MSDVLFSKMLLRNNRGASPCVGEIRVTTAGTVIFECRNYPYVDNEDVPDDDIFLYIMRSVATPRRQISYDVLLA
jgi:hypothetical protein